MKASSSPAFVLETTPNTGMFIKIDRLLKKL